MRRLLTHPIWSRAIPLLVAMGVFTAGIILTHPEAPAWLFTLYCGLLMFSFWLVAIGLSARMKRK